MFTGIIEDIGKIQQIRDSQLTIMTKLKDIKVGDSIAINGICLTVTYLNKIAGKNSLKFDFSPETKKFTTISDWQENNGVNMERALKIGERLGGHFVTGHIDGVGKILKVSKKDNSIVYEINASKNLAPFFIEKGSVAIDGISLTIVSCNENKIVISIIPHTLQETVLKERSAGDMVNIETDMLAKQAVKVLSKRSSGLSKEMLKDNGFL